MKATYAVMLYVEIDTTKEGPDWVTSYADGVDHGSRADDLELSSKSEELINKALSQLEMDAIRQFKEETDTSGPENFPLRIPS